MKELQSQLQLWSLD